MTNTYNSKQDTLDHKQAVFILGKEITNNFIARLLAHDNSKLESPEKEVFDEMTPKLKTSTYGSDEYNGFLVHMQEALKHHYLENAHHPEHFPNGIKDMSLIDLIEMLTDWKAATLRHDDGDILRSIEINQNRFGYSDELKQILLNTIKELDWA